MEKSIIMAVLLIEINRVCLGFTKARKEREATLTQTNAFCLLS